MQGHDPDDPVCVDRPVEPTAPLIGRGIDGLRIAIAGGYFRERRISRGADGGRARRRRRSASPARSKFPRPNARAPPPMSSPRPKARRCISIACARARDDFDPAVRDRLIAGAMVPADAGRTRRRNSAAGIARACSSCSSEVDAILAPCDALHRADDRPADLRARRRRDAGARRTSASTRSRSRSSACRWWRCRCRSTPLPIGVQIIAAPWREDVALRIAHALEQAGVAAAPRPNIFREHKDGDRPAGGRRRGQSRVRSLRAGAGDERRRRARRDLPRRRRAPSATAAAKTSTATTRSRRSARRARRPGWRAPLSRTVITTYGRDFAVASTLFHRASVARQDRPPDADLGALPGRLARGRRARQHDRRAEELALLCAMKARQPPKLEMSRAPATACGLDQKAFHGLRRRQAGACRSTAAAAPPRRSGRTPPPSAPRPRPRSRSPRRPRRAAVPGFGGLVPASAKSR